MKDGYIFYVREAALDEDAAMRARADNSFKGRLFYDEVVPMIKSLLLKRDVPPYKWEDLIDELYFSYDKALQAYDPSRQAAFSTFLYKVLDNDLLQLLEKEPPTVPSSELEEEDSEGKIKPFLETIPSIYFTPEQEAIYKDYVEQLEKLIAETKDPLQKEVLVGVLEQKSLKEIARSVAEKAQELGIDLPNPLHFVIGLLRGKSELSRRLKEIVSYMLGKYRYGWISREEYERRKRAQEELGVESLMPGGQTSVPEPPKEEDEEEKAKKILLEDIRRIKYQKKPKSKKEVFKFLEELGWTRERLEELIGKEVMEEKQ